MLGWYRKGAFDSKKDVNNRGLSWCVDLLDFLWNYRDNFEKKNHMVACSADSDCYKKQGVMFLGMVA